MLIEIKLLMNIITDSDWPQYGSYLELMTKFEEFRILIIGQLVTWWKSMHNENSELKLCHWINLCNNNHSC